MNGFVEIKTMFISEEERNIETLSEKYYQKIELMQVIKSILKNHLLTRNSIMKKKNTHQAKLGAPQSEA